MDILNRQKFRTTPNNHGFPMTLFWFLMVALVLGGLLASHWYHASLWFQETRRGIGFRKVRVPVAKRPHRTSCRAGTAPLGSSRQRLFRSARLLMPLRAWPLTVAVIHATSR